MSEPLKCDIPALDLTAVKWLAAWIENMQREMSARRVRRAMQQMLESRGSKSISYALYTSESSISHGRFCLRSICKRQQPTGVN